MVFRIWLCITALMLATAQPALAADPAGVAPRYTSRTLSKIPNAQAVTRRIWAPGIDAGYVPQGLSFVGGAIYVSAFRSTHKKVSKGPCRLYRIDPKSGRITGKLNLPRACTHAGGLARGKAGILYLSDTHTLFKIALAALSSPAIGRVVQVVKLNHGIKGYSRPVGPARFCLVPIQRSGVAPSMYFGPAHCQPD